MLFRKFEAVETAEGTKYLLDGEEIRHVVGCSLELLSAERSRYLLTLKVAVSNCTYRVKHGTEEEDTSYHQLRVKMEGFCPDSVQLDNRAGWIRDETARWRPWHRGDAFDVGDHRRRNGQAI